MNYAKFIIFSRINKVPQMMVKLSSHVQSARLPKGNSYGFIKVHDMEVTLTSTLSTAGCSNLLPLSTLQPFLFIYPGS